MRLAWARHQLARGQAVWSTPDIHTWEAWLTRQWREAVQRGGTPAAQLLDAGQERALWETVLARLAGEGDAGTLGMHAGALMQAAARATQAQLALADSAQSAEETLLATALAKVRSECSLRGLLSLRLAPAESLGFLARAAAPLIAGEVRLTALQAALGRRFWPDARLLLENTATELPPPRLRRATGLEQELAACAAWCRAHVEGRPEARLLVMSACTEPSLSIQAELFWRALATGSNAGEAERDRWLAVEGGAPLLHQALIRDALAALDIASADATASAIQTQDILALLQSPSLDLGPVAARAGLADWFSELGLGQWRPTDLREALAQGSATMPAAQQLGEWLAGSRGLLAPDAPQPCTEWARRFSAALELAGFTRSTGLDSRTVQRLTRWLELLDEFAAQDAVGEPLRVEAATRRLRRLAGLARHQAASADAAVTFSASLADPVAGYDGIWVLGLAEGRWPAPPRPDAWVPLAAQRSAGWPESGVVARREQAQWALARWQARAGELVLSHPVCEGDLSHRPSALAGTPGDWADLTEDPPLPIIGVGTEATDQQLQPVAEATLSEPLAGGVSRLVSQQACPFRAQAQWRLLARPPSRISAGVPAAVRGRLLHLLLQHLWQELHDQAGLLALEASAVEPLLARCWNEAVRATPAAGWLEQTVLMRERSRALALVSEVLELERRREPFAVSHRERSVSWSGAGARIRLRIDRIDTVDEGAVLLDYKSGAAVRSDLHKGTMQPLQLAVYVAALAQLGETVSAAALLNLSPADPGFSGVAVRKDLLPDGLHEAGADWATMQQQWQQQLLLLMEQHLGGGAALTEDPQACNNCHLPSLCRRAGADAQEAGEE